MSIAVVFVGGPLDGERRIVPDAPPHFYAKVCPAGVMPISETMRGDVKVDTVVYRLFRWESRYIYTTLSLAEMVDRILTCYRPTKIKAEPV